MRLTTFSMASSMPVELSQDVFVLTHTFNRTPYTVRWANFIIIYEPL